MGFGKSARQNYWDLFFLFMPGITRLPWLSKIDIGPSSLGMIKLIRAMLPHDRKHEAIYLRYRQEDKYSTNPFDTPLGCEFPFVHQIESQINFVTVLCSESGQSVPSFVSALSRLILKKCFNKFSRDEQPKPYNKNLSYGFLSDVYRYVNNSDLLIDEQTSWFEVVDHAFQAGNSRIASLAHRMTAPLLSDIIMMSSDKTITQQYSNTIQNGSLLEHEYFKRLLLEAQDRYPVLNHPTQVDLSNARVVSLDLEEVAQRGTFEQEKQAGVMYMLARQLVFSRFLDRIEDIPSVPDLYKSYHSKRIESISQDPKRYDMDEAHRFLISQGVKDQVISDLDVASRESRKHQMSLGLSTQDISDIPDTMLEFITSLYVMGVGTRKTAEAIAERFSMPKAAVHTMVNQRKPDASGADVLAYHKTDIGDVTQQQKVTMGGLILTALNTTKEDVVVLTKVEQALEYLDALTIISKTYPSGLKKEIEKRKKASDQTSLLQGCDDHESRLAEELIQAHRRAA